MSWEREINETLREIRDILQRVADHYIPGDRPKESEPSEPSEPCKPPWEVREKFETLIGRADAEYIRQQILKMKGLYHG